MQLYKTLALVHQRGPKQERQPLKSLSGVAKPLLFPTRFGLDQCRGLHYCGVASGCLEECQGTSKSPCPCQVAAMEVPWSAMSCCGDRRLPSEWVTAPLPALCPLPSPGRFLLCCPGARCVPAARGTPFTDLRPWDEQRREGWRHARSRARVSAGVPRPGTPNRGLALWCAATGSGASPSVTPPTGAGKGSQDPAGSRPPAGLLRQRCRRSLGRRPKEASQALRGDTDTQPIRVVACLVNKRCPGFLFLDYQDLPTLG